MIASPDALTELLTEIRGCRICEAHLPLGPRPILAAASSARILLVGQAPGSKVHATGIPWNDPSGERLRAWLDMPNDIFYDPAQIAIVPMGFCYPGKGERGDLPPRPECAVAWQEKLRAQLPDIRLTIAIGQYAVGYYLSKQKKKTLAETVRHWAGYAAQGIIPLPHPSPRNIMWRRRHPWFEAEVVPQVRAQVWQALEG